MLIAAQSHGDRLVQSVKLMGKHWLIFVIAPLMIGIISLLLLGLIIGLLSILTLSFNIMPETILLRTIFLVLPAVLPTALGSLISAQILLFALKDLENGNQLVFVKLLKQSFKNLGRFFLVSIYTYLYIYKYILILFAAILIPLLFSSVPQNNNLPSDSGPILPNLSSIWSIILLILVLLFILLVLVRVIHTLFTQIACIKEALPASKALRRSVEVSKKHWKETLIHFAILMGLAILIGSIIGDTESILSSLIWMVASSVSVIMTYLLYQHLTGPATTQIAEKVQN